MAAQAGRAIQDQNLNVHHDVAPLGVKTSFSKAEKNGKLSVRKALNDISNSGRPSSLQTAKKQNWKNTISVGEGIVSSKLQSSLGEKITVSKAAETAKAGGRKALGDLTNYGKQHIHQASKKTGKKLSAVAEDQILPNNVAEEGFLHNHQECVKAQLKGPNMKYFLEIIGLDQDNTMHVASPRVSPLPVKLKPESPPRYLEMEEISELPYEDEHRWKKTPHGSPKSPQPQWKAESPKFMLMKAPKLQKH
ncbi:protein PATRONUS 2-like isoform X1 [Diospyros lotus]|uniref:protein PATRONUS 2-like isoform X1 n=1 Tax=Diospyros lotus TaxID=55363 RepID=UPI0022506024|nr:protein PATRONUS 2-like isoform X1 [Diospyros lotus]XP_052184240.1 protein PATRONUS 2-like isoform X1 [Diospyros lotus]